jgi:hypothetical protein
MAVIPEAEAVLRGPSGLRDLQNRSSGYLSQKISIDLICEQ